MPVLRRGTGAPEHVLRAVLSPITIREATPVERERWDEIVERFPDHRVVHKRAWIDWLEACDCGHALYLLFERDGAIVGAIPGLLVHVGPFRLYGSPLPGWQTPAMGPVFDPARLDTAEIIDALIPYLERTHHIHHVEIMSRTLAPADMRAAGMHGAPIGTYRAPLYPGDPARAWKQLKDSARRNIKRAEKLGLIVRFEEQNETFVAEHYAQVHEVFVRGGHAVSFSEARVNLFFQRMRDAGKLVAVSVYLPDGTSNIASGIFTIDGRELLLLSWAHHTAHRWYRPTELMTWAVMQRAMARGCDTFDLMGLGEFKTKFGAVADMSTQRWVRSRYQWLTLARNLAQGAYRSQQVLRGRIARVRMFGLRHSEHDEHLEPTKAATAKPLRVFMATSQWPVTPWGTPQFVARQAQFLRDAGVDVDVFHFEGLGNPANYAKAWVRAQRQLARKDYDLVHAQFGQSALMALPRRLPLVITLRGDDLLGILDDTDGHVTIPGRVLQRFSQWVANRADAVIIVSGHMRQYLNGAPVHIVPSGIDFELFRPLPRDEARRRLGLDPSGRYVLFIGSPHIARKRYTLADQAVTILSRTTPTQLLLGWNVPHKDMPYYLNAADALVFTSMQEGSPNAVKEALACNVPVVSVPVGDVPERIRDIDGCELCHDERPEAIAQALERVLARGQRIKGRDAVLHLDEHTTTRRVIDIYREALARHART